MSVSVEVLRPELITDKDVVELNQLVQEFKPGSPALSLTELQEIAERGLLIVAHAGDIQTPVVGMATLVIYRKPTGCVGMVEDVVVAEAARGRGAGRSIMTLLIEVAKENGCKNVSLTSNPRRVAARSLYRSLGFRERDTTFFQLKF